MLDIDKIYPILFPGKPVPNRKLLCGGLGMPDLMRCAACETHLPNKTEWLNYGDVEARAATNPSLYDEKGKLKLQPHQGWTHNPCKCVTLHRLVQEHIAQHPENAWMSEPRRA